MSVAFDVMLPYYGDVDLMKQAVRSVLAQTHDDWHLTVVDDGFPDPEPARWFAEMDDARVTYLRNEVNLGANGNYRKCLDMVQAPHMVMMGADDVMLPDHLSVLAASFASCPTATVVHPGVEVIDEDGRPVRPVVDRMKRAYAPRGDRCTVLAGEEWATSVLRANWTYFPAMGWRTEAVRSVGFRTGLDVVQDLALMLDLAMQGGSMVVEPSPTFLYRRWSSQDSSVRALDGSRFDEERRFFLEESATMRLHGWPRAARVARWHVSSRANALTRVPRATRLRGVGAAVRLGRHVLDTRGATTREGRASTGGTATTG